MREARPEDRYSINIPRCTSSIDLGTGRRCSFFFSPSSASPSPFATFAALSASASAAASATCSAPMAPTSSPSNACAVATRYLSAVSALMSQSSSMRRTRRDADAGSASMQAISASRARVEGSRSGRPSPSPSPLPPYDDRDDGAADGTSSRRTSGATVGAHRLHPLRRASRVRRLGTGVRCGASLSPSSACSFNCRRTIATALATLSHLDEEPSTSPPPRSCPGGSIVP
mmetsp:Transcript_3576/g.9562  ORF Transcript_3576/g.9562 Transcript_3576/m.9562 type:complete len:230 (+) Transcript_3576:820-1509(+)